MQSLLSLREKPPSMALDQQAFDDMTARLNQPLPEERELFLAFQSGDNPETRQALPRWMSKPIEKMLFQWVDEKKKWDKRKQARGSKELPSAQLKQYNDWLSNYQVLDFLFSKKTQGEVKTLRANADMKKIQEEMFSVQVVTASDLNDLKIKAGNGTAYQLLLLQGEAVQVDELPLCLDQGVASSAVASLQEGEQVKEPGSEEEDPENIANQGMLDEEEAMLEEELGEDVMEDIEVMADSSDEEMLDKMMHSNFTRVKTFMHRPVYKKFEEMGIALIPSHIGGVFVSFHSTSRTWQGFYPGCHEGLSMTFGGRTKSCSAYFASVLIFFGGRTF